MTKCVVFDNIYEARKWNLEKSGSMFGFHGSQTKYKFSMKPLSETTQMSKVDYAENEKITQYFEDEDGQAIENPKYAELVDTYVLNKFAVVVNDSLIERAYDEETGELISETEPVYVVDIEIPETQGE